MHTRQNFGRRSLLLSAASLSLLGLAACSGGSTASADASQPRDFGIPARQEVSAQAIKRHGSGAPVGRMMAAKEVFVFFDPKCPHCAMLWVETEKLRKELKFTWIPVAFMGQGSAGAGMEVLDDPHPEGALTAHAAKVLVAMRLGQRPVMPADPAPSEKLDRILKNTQLLKSFGQTSVPFVVAIDAQGKTVLSEAGAKAEAIAAALGLPTAGV